MTGRERTEFLIFANTQQRNSLDLNKAESLFRL